MGKAGERCDARRSDAETPAGTPAGVEPGSGWGGVSI
jgi:hypothetical protein